MCFSCPTGESCALTATVKTSAAMDIFMDHGPPRAAFDEEQLPSVPQSLYVRGRAKPAEHQDCGRNIAFAETIPGRVQDNPRTFAKCQISFPIPQRLVPANPRETRHTANAGRRDRLT